LSIKTIHIALIVCLAGELLAKQMNEQKKSEERYLVDW
jgi:hypothetical protein